MFSLVGNGSHAQDLLAICKRRGYSVANTYDDDPERGDTPPADLSGYVLFGTYYPWQRRELAARFPNAVGAPPLTDISAVIGTDCDMGTGCVVSNLSTLCAAVRLGNHVHVGYHVGVTRTNVGDFSTLSPGAIICGDCEIGEAVFVGANATICDRSTIGDDVVIAAGAIVPPLSVVPSGSKVLGLWKP